MKKKFAILCLMAFCLCMTAACSRNDTKSGSMADSKGSQSGTVAQKGASLLDKAGDAINNMADDAGSAIDRMTDGTAR